MGQSEAVRPQITSVRLCPRAQADYTFLRDWLRSQVAGGIRITATAVVTTALRLAVEKIFDGENQGERILQFGCWPPGTITPASRGDARPG